MCKAGWTSEEKEGLFRVGKQRLVPAQRVEVPVKLAGADKEQKLFEDRISNR